MNDTRKAAAGGASGAAPRHDPDGRAPL